VVPKPAHLGPRYAAQFEDESVALAYHTRPSYPGELFSILESLMPPGPRSVLDLGCGTGDAALGLAGCVERVDAVDPSRAMLRVARGRPGAARVRFVESSAETFRPETRYSMIVAAESLHWMEWRLVFEWLPQALQPGAVLCLVSGRELQPVPWQRELGALLGGYSTNREYRPYDLVLELASRGLFAELGRRETSAMACEQSLDDYVESFHTRNGFSRQRMTAEAARAFDEALRRLAVTHGAERRVRGSTRASVIWGRPLRPAG
jgi:SAM-dependent methyltransferase